MRALANAEDTTVHLENEGGVIQVPGRYTLGQMIPGK